MKKKKIHKVCMNPVHMPSRLNPMGTNGKYYIENVPGRSPRKIH